MWIYVLGERTGADIKIGHTTKPTVRQRMNVVNAEANEDTYVLLAAVRSSKLGEDAAKRYFAAKGLTRPKGGRTEYFHLADDLVQWVLWLRQQPFVSFDDRDLHDEAPEAHPDEWIPKPGRTTPPPPTDPDQLVQPHTQLVGPLAGTVWDWMPDMTMSFQDYFTDPPIVRAASVGMGGIDLDAASHWIAQRRLRKNGVVIPDYLHTNRSAFDHPWYGNVWLNPPYGDNDRWFTRALEMMDGGNMRQLAMLSPVYAFTTGIAQEFMRRAQAAILFSPTPKFYNPADPDKTGTNLPHAIVYWGDRCPEFLAALSAFGIPITIAWDHLPTTTPPANTYA